MPEHFSRDIEIQDMKLGSPEAMKQEPHDAHIFEEQEMLKSMAEARAEYDAYKERKYQEECPHDELDHGICMDCGKDCFDDVIAAAEFRADCLEDR